MRDLVEQARKLGEAIAGHERTKAFFAAEAAVRADAEARQILDEYRRHAQHVYELETTRKPIEVADKKKLADLQKRMAGNDRIREYMRRQADYLEMMNSVNDAMEAALAGAKKDRA